MCAALDDETPGRGDRGSFSVASEGFEPPNAEQSDLQSDPFGRLGNSPFALPTTSQLLTEGAT